MLKHRTAVMANDISKISTVSHVLRNEGADPNRCTLYTSFNSIERGYSFVNASKSLIEKHEKKKKKNEKKEKQPSKRYISESR